MIVRHGHARELIPQVAGALKVDAVFVNHDYEPDAIERDDEVARKLKADDRAFRDFKAPIPPRPATPIRIQNPRFSTVGA